MGISQMNDETTIYRVIRRSRWAGDKDWYIRVQYCGPDRIAARCAYHESTPTDTTGSEQDPEVQTTCECISDDGTDFKNDHIGVEKPA